MSRFAGIVLLAVALFANTDMTTAAEAGPAHVIQAIGRDIAKLKNRFPQLSQFSVSQHVHPDRLSIDYGYRTHRAEHGGGWTAGVPNPDDDGIWFFIDFHAPDSTAQIHTQPAQLSQSCLGDKRLSFLILEGKSTKSVNGALWRILKQHGVRPCP
jgi:hypothetical protein